MFEKESNKEIILFGIGMFLGVLAICALSIGFSLVCSLIPWGFRKSTKALAWGISFLYPITV